MKDPKGMNYQFSKTEMDFQFLNSRFPCSILKHEKPTSAIPLQISLKQNLSIRQRPDMMVNIQLFLSTLVGLIVVYTYYVRLLDASIITESMKPSRIPRILRRHASSTIMEVMMLLGLIVWSRQAYLLPMA